MFNNQTANQPTFFHSKRFLNIDDNITYAFNQLMFLVLNLFIQALQFSVNIRSRIQLNLIEKIYYGKVHVSFIEEFFNFHLMPPSNTFYSLFHDQKLINRFESIINVDET